MLLVKGIGRTLDELYVLSELCSLTPQLPVQFRIFQSLYEDTVPVPGAVSRGEDAQFQAVDIEYPFETFAHAYGPCQGGALDLEFIFDVRKYIQGLHALPVQFVDKGDDGGVSHAADLHQLPCLGLHPLG